ncbi:hypothetical protein ACET3Z_015573 [Daucus carota]
MAASELDDRSLQEIPTWAVALVCAVFIIISISIEHGILSLAKKMKAELMILGFISLLLTVSTTYVVKICIPIKLGKTLLPCKHNHEKRGLYDDHVQNEGGDRRKLLSFEEAMMWRRGLAVGGEYEIHEDYCATKGRISLISYKGVHQLHMCIFVLVVFHVLYSIILMALGQAKMMKWKAWEAEATSLEYQVTVDPKRLRIARQTTFVKRHIGFSREPLIRWTVAFFRQFLGSISKADYMAIRSGFINAHFAPNSKFNFHKYIRRSMEDDYKKVLGISIPLWISALIFLILNVYDWHTLTWLSIVPLLILVMVGTKLELVIMDMAQQINDQAITVRGSPMVQPSDEFFWFHRPQWILILIHLTLFQNAFQMAFFLFTLFEFGNKPCFHEKLISVLLRVVLGVALHVLCSYITFPLYSLVTQMGSHMKESIFQEQTAKALKNWHKSAKENQKKLRKAAGPAAFVAASVCEESRQSESIPHTPVSSCESEHGDDQHWDLEASAHISQPAETTKVEL